MSNHDNHRRDEQKRTEHGPRWEKSNPSGQRGVARGRKRWKDLNTRRERRTGKTGGWSPTPEEVMLTKKQIRKLIELTQQKTVAEFDGYKVVRHEGGYSDDKEIGAIQAALSIMLEVAPR